MANPVGRPTLYKPEYCDLLIKHMENGYSFEAFGAVVGVSKQTLYDWLAMHQEFVDAKSLATMKGQHFWESLGIEASKGQIESFSATAWVFNMKNRFNWKDKQEVEQTNQNYNVEVSAKDLKEEIRKARLEKNG